MTTIVIATIKSWNIENAYKLIRKLRDKYKVIIIEKKEELTYERMNDYKPQYIFFPHWSWIIPEEIYCNFQCIVFHMTDLPYGRGGSPLQNLIVNKQYETKISAIVVEKGLDTGKIYLKEDCYIGIGSAEEILMRISNIIFKKMIPVILAQNLIPVEQSGKVVNFQRRTSDQSCMEHQKFTTLTEIYDFVRMLDGEGYPGAFIRMGDYKIMFSEVKRKNKKLVGRFEILKDEK